MTDFLKWPMIARGSERMCFLNPSDPYRCVKVSLKTNDKQTKREIQYFKQLIARNASFDCIPRFYGVVETDKYIGFEQELIRDNISEEKLPPLSTSIEHFFKKQISNEEKQTLFIALEKLKAYLISENIIPSDLNPCNILVQKNSTGIKLYLIDGLGSTEFIPASNYIPLIGQLKINRKWDFFYKKMNRRYPHLNLG